MPIKRLAKIIPVLLLCAFMVGCKPPAPPAYTGGKIKITSTTGMVHDLVVNIGGDRVETAALMGPGVDPHLYKASQGDLKSITGAEIIFYNGLHLEGKMADVFEKMSRSKTVVAVTKDISPDRLLRVSGTTYDPHVWFEIALWKTAAGTVLHTLQQYDTAGADYYAQNFKKYAAKMDSAEMYVRKRINEIPENKRILITAHDAFGYYGRAYGLRVEALQGISTVAETGLSDITRITELVKITGIKAVFAETSVSDKSIKAVMEGCRAKGVELKQGGYLYSDAPGTPESGAGTYLGMVITNTDLIADALKE